MKRNGIIVLEVLTVAIIVGMATVTSVELSKADTVENTPTTIASSK